MFTYKRIIRTSIFARLDSTGIETGFFLIVTVMQVWF